MRRLTRAILCCAPLGVITTIAIAWAAAWMRPSPTSTSGLFWIDRASSEAWMGFGEHGPGWRTLTLYGASGVTDAGMALATPLDGWIHPPEEGPLDSRAMTAIGAGWPMVCLRAQRIGVGHDEPQPGAGWRTGMGPQWVEWQPWRGAMALGDPNSIATDPARLLPIGILWPGFAANIALWTTVWSLPMLALAMRRLIRRRGNRCEACGYDLRGNVDHRCPECGLATR